MAEDQGVNGDAWNDYVVHLLSQFGWEKIGDVNMDLTGEEGEANGVDAIMAYEQPGMQMKRSIIVESKRYKSTSYSKVKLYGWLETLNKKLDHLRNSDSLLEQFPLLQECEEIKHGIIMNWITDADEKFLEEYLAHFSEYHNTSSASLRGWKRIAVLNNERINRLRSILQVMKDNKIQFYYPAQLSEGNVGSYKSILTLEYMFSDIILAVNAENTDKVVFYFGEMNYESLNTLSECLNLYQYLIEGGNMQVYYYHDDDDIRKILPAIQTKLFSKINVTFNALEEFALNKIPHK